ncbi:MAG: 4-hydroxy-tetrahydrodipicolinate synthase [Phycisphaerae bacterium]
MPHFSGSITALVTPFENDKVDFVTLEALVERQIAAGIDGLVPCGTTGESPTLTEDEQHAVIESVVKFTRKRAKVIAGTGSFSTAKMLHASRHAAEVGADGLLIVSPYYNKPTQAGLYEHFAAVARDVKLPIMLYNIPGRCGVEISIPTIARLRRDFANIVSVKHATGRCDDAAELASVSDIEIMSGDDPITLPLMSLGALGVVSVMTNLVPRAVKRLTDAALKKDFAGALAAHRALYPLMKGLLSLETNPIPIKTAMAIRGLCSEEMRLPMCAISAENRAKLEALLSEHTFE